MNLREQLAKKWIFPWQAMDVLIGGKSSIDLADLRVHDFSEATKFLCSYGYNPDNQKDKQVIHEVFAESIHFIDKYLLPLCEKGSRCPPKEVLLFEDIRQLLLFASSNDDKLKSQKAWSCAILRVMHTIAHIEGLHRLIDIETAADQIQQRFREHVYRDKKGRLWLGEVDSGVELYKIDWKRAKTRQSIILKLLHKRANVAENIFDLIGVRIVTKNLSDVMIVVKYLRQYFMVNLPNSNPARSRNTLFDVSRFRDNVEMLRDMLVSKRLAPEEFPRLIERLTRGSSDVESSSTNPHSSTTYRAIQLTCRQLIRCANPRFAWISRLENQLKEIGNENDDSKSLRSFLTFVKQWPGVEEALELSSFFPFEVQILDQGAYVTNQSGEAAHDRYKNSQIRAARRRVMGDVLKLTK